MISFSKLKSAKSADHYFMEKDNYYLRSDEYGERFEWWGKGAAKLGLAKNVAPDVFLDLLNGQLPNGEEIPVGVNGKRRPGFDITFSAPKSVSMLALIYKDIRLIEAHQAAVDATLAEIEKEAAQARIKLPGSDEFIFERTGNLTVAKFLHDVSRELDPQLHTHCVVMNFTERLDGKWRALASKQFNESNGQYGVVDGFLENLHQRKIYFGLIYRAELAKRLVDMGYEIEVDPEKKHGLFEIKGIPNPLLQMFSKRREQIKSMLYQLGWRSPRAGDYATMISRRDKEMVDREELRNYWRAQVDNNFAGFDPERMIQISKGLEFKEFDPEAHKMEVRLQAAKTAVMEAARHYSEMKLTFNHSELITQGLIFGMGQATFSDINTAIAQLKQEKALLPVDHHQLTTAELLRFESTLIEQVKQTQGKAVVNKVPAHVLESLKGTVEQKQAVADILSSKDNAVLVNLSLYEHPGEFLNGLLQIAEASGKTIKILTPTKANRTVLGNEVKRKSFNAWQWVINHFKPEVACTIRGYLYKNQQRDELDRLHTADNILVVDQAHKIGYEDFEGLLKHAEAQNSKLVFLNSEEGFKGLSGGNPISLLRKAKVSEINLKSTRPPELNVSVAVREFKEDDVRAKAIAEQYVRLTEKERLDTHIIAHCKAQVDNIHGYIRNGLKAAGVLSHAEKVITVLNPVATTKETQKFAGTYKPGMLVKRFVTEKGKTEVLEYRVLKHIEGDNLVKLEDSKGEIIHWNPKKERWQSQLFKEESLALSTGERIVAQQAMHQLGIAPGDQIRIDRLLGSIVSLRNLNSKRTVHTTLSCLHHGSFKYAYANVLGQTKKERRANVILDIKGFAANQAVIHEVQSRAKNSLDILTDDVDKLQTHAAKEHLKLTTLDTLMSKGQEIQTLQKYIDAKTLDLVQHDIEKIAVCLLEHYGDIDKRSLVEKSLDFAIEKLSEREAAFKHDDLIKTAITYGLNKIKPEETVVTLENIEGTLVRYQQSGRLLLSPEKTFWVTKEALECERVIIQNLKTTRNNQVALCEAEALAASLEQTHLTKGQKEAASLILTTTDQFVMIQGDAGTGKTAMMSQVTKELLVHLKQTLKANGSSIEILGLAPTHQAVKEMSEIGLESQTLKSFLVACEQDAEGKLDLSNKLIVLDEYSMVSNKDALEFMEVVRKYNGRAVKVGDIKQLEAIPAGRPMHVEYHSGEIKVARMDEIVRQQNKAALETAQYAAKGNIYQALKTAAKVDARQYIQRDENSMTMDEQFRLEKSLVQAKRDNLEVEVANEYLARTPEVRAQSSFIVQRHKNREAITDLIREGLKERNELAAEGAFVRRLVPVNLTVAEIKEVSPINDKKASFIKLGNTYYKILETDPENHSLALKDEAGNFKAIHLKHDLKRFKDNIEVFQERHSEICKNDQIMIKKSNPALGLYGNHEYVVTDYQGEKLTLCDKGNGKEITLDTEMLNQTHWDYAYTKTGYSEQGATHLYTVDVRFADDQDLANVRSAYISLTRHKQHFMLFTDNAKAILRQLITEKDKTSALEAMNELHVDPTRLEAKPTSLSIAQKATVSEKPAIERKEYKRWNYQVVNDALMARAEETYLAIFGEPKQRQGAQWRWSGGLIATVRGTKAGLWNSFTEKKAGGGPIQAIQYYLNMPYKEAMQYAINLAGLSEAEATTTEYIEITRQKHKERAEQSKQAELKDQEQRIESARSIWSGSLPIQGTLAERYFKEHRQVESLDNMEIRFWPQGAKWISYDKEGNRQEKTNSTPAAVIVAKDQEGEVAAVQRIYLDPQTAGKSKKMNDPKLSKGMTKGNPGIVQMGMPGSRLYVAEGPETAASIAMVDPEATVLVSFGVRNLVNLAPAIKKYKASEVILAADNDGKETKESNTYQTTEEAARNLKSKGVHNLKVLYPKDISGHDKVDWNDVLKTQGAYALKMQLGVPVKSESLKLTDPIEQKAQEIGSEPIVLNPGDRDSKISFIMLDFNNALSVEAALPGHQIIANPLSNYKALSPKQLSPVVVVCLNNHENLEEQKQLEEMVDHLKAENKTVWVTFPKNGKTFHEVANKEGVDAVRNELKTTLIPVEQFMKAPKHYLTDSIEKHGAQLLKNNELDLSKLSHRELNQLVKAINQPSPGVKMQRMAPIQMVKQMGEREL